MPTSVFSSSRSSSATLIANVMDTERFMAGSSLKKFHAHDHKYQECSADLNQMRLTLEQ